MTLEITAGQRDAREKLLDNFDQEVVEKVRIQSAGLLDRFNERLWLLTRYVLADYAQFDTDEDSFYLTRNPFSGETIYPRPYRLGKNVTDGNLYRVGHPLAQRVLTQAMALNPGPAEVEFSYSGSGKNIAALTPLVGKSGWLTCSRLEVQSLEGEDTLLLAALTDDHEPLDETACRRLFDLSGREIATQTIPNAVRSWLADAIGGRRNEYLDTLSVRNGQWFDTEMEKLDRWADDRRAALAGELEDLDQEIKDTKKSARMAPNLPAKLELQRKLRGLETKRDEAWRSYDTASRENRPPERRTTRRNRPAVGTENGVQDVVHAAMEDYMKKRTGFLPATSGGCGSSSEPTVVERSSHRWCENRATRYLADHGPLETRRGA